jgi:hypothetical protein
MIIVNVAGCLRIPVQDYLAEAAAMVKVNADAALLFAPSASRYKVALQECIDIASG